MACRAGRSAICPQLAEVDRTFPITVRDAVGLGLWHRIGLFGEIDRADRQRVAAALATVGIEAMAERPIGALSVGQFQRLLFARLIVQDPAGAAARRAVCSP